MELHLVTALGRPSFEDAETKRGERANGSGLLCVFEDLTAGVVFLFHVSKVSQMPQKASFFFIFFRARPLPIFEKIQQDGKTKYKRVKGQHLYNPVNLRGQYSSFFASAVMAGIIKNIKRGRKFIITKGPNFEAFKEGKLRAL